MITDIRIYPSINSKGEISVKVGVKTESGLYYASVPSGTSKGSSEAKEISFEKARKIFPKLRHRIIGTQEDFERVDRMLREIDRTQNFSKIGGNLALGISIAVARAQSKGELWKLKGLGDEQKFPIPVGNVIGGGSHGGGTDWQEFLLIPYAAKSPLEAIQSLVEVWAAIGDEIREKKLLIGRNLENAWMAHMDEEETLEFLSQIADDWRMRTGVDIAASALWNGRHYNYKKSGEKLTPEQQLDFVKEMAERYKIWYIEDPFRENSFVWFSHLNKEIGRSHLVVGDDLYCTQIRRLEKGIHEKATNGIIIKPNQAGTLFQSERVVSIAQKYNIFPVVSHRSGETGDDWIADLSILWKAPLIKTGVMGMERLAKHNRLIQLWEEVPEPKMAEINFL